MKIIDFLDVIVPAGGMSSYGMRSGEKPGMEAWFKKFWKSCGDVEADFNDTGPSTACTVVYFKTYSSKVFLSNRRRMNSLKI